MPKKTKKNVALDRLLRSAEAHGIESEPDHEVGDLQDILRAAFGKLTDEQADAVATEFFAENEEWTIDGASVGSDEEE